MHDSRVCTIYKCSAIRTDRSPSIFVTDFTPKSGTEHHSSKHNLQETRDSIITAICHCSCYIPSGGGQNNIQDTNFQSDVAPEFLGATIFIHIYFINSELSFTHHPHVIWTLIHVHLTRIHANSHW